MVRVPLTGPVIFDATDQNESKGLWLVISPQEKIGAAANVGSHRDAMTRMINGARKVSRRKMGSPAWIRPEEGFSVQKCIISDISSTGVRLVVDRSAVTMKRFRLLTRRHAARGCLCLVRWRRGLEIGAEFLPG
jgi:hypothetical protein